MFLTRNLDYHILNYLNPDSETIANMSNSLVVVYIIYILLAFAFSLRVGWKLPRAFVNLIHYVDSPFYLNPATFHYR